MKIGKTDMNAIWWKLMRAIAMTHSIGAPDTTSEVVEASDWVVWSSSIQSSIRVISGLFLKDTMEPAKEGLRTSKLGSVKVGRLAEA